jgi:hypothetical protein
MRMTRAGVPVESMMTIGAYQFFAADQWTCPECNKTIFAGIHKPIAEHFQSDYRQVVDQFRMSRPVHRYWRDPKEKAEFLRRQALPPEEKPEPEPERQNAPGKFLAEDWTLFLRAMFANITIFTDPLIHEVRRRMLANCVRNHPGDEPQEGEKPASAEMTAEERETMRCLQGLYALQAESRNAVRHFVLDYMPELEPQVKTWVEIG